MIINKKQLKRLLIRTGFPALRFSNINRLFQPFYSGIGSVIYFHRVCDPQRGPRIPSLSALEVSQEFLEKTIKFFLSKNYQIVSLDDLDTALSGKPFQKPLVVFTFDDGYRDNLSHAYPVFKKYSLPFTIYVTTGFVERRSILWWALLEELIINRKKISFDFGEKTYNFFCRSQSEKEYAFSKIHALFMKYQGNKFMKTVKAILETNGLDLYQKTDELMLNWMEIKKLSNDPLVTLAAHTENHFSLSKLSPEELKEEVTNSKNLLESKTSRPVKHFAYPYGSRDEAGPRDFSLVKGFGFRTATTTRPGNIFLEHDIRRECLPRIPINEKVCGKNLEFLKLWLSGTIPAMMNNFRKIENN